MTSKYVGPTLQGQLIRPGVLVPDGVIDEACFVPDPYRMLWNVGVQRKDAMSHN